MRHTIILLSLALSFIVPVKANGYKAQQLEPVMIKDDSESKLFMGRTYNVHQRSRVLAPKRRIYPFLDQLEHLLYPGKDFKAENPGARLERLELAVFGNKQQGKIDTRVEKLKNEVESWQIANAQVMGILNSDPKKDNAYNASKLRARGSGLRVDHNHVVDREFQMGRPRALSPEPRTFHYNVSSRVRNKSVDYDYQNYRLVSPLIQNIGRRSIDLLFK